MKNLRMMLMAGILLPLLSVNAEAGQTVYEEGLLTSVSCEEPKDCAEMGYTANAADCAGPALKCPWDLTKAMCEKYEMQLPNAVLYGDGTISKKFEDLESGKVPIGMVVDEERRIAIALTDVKKDGTPGRELMPWSDVQVDTAIVNAKSGDLDTTATDGQANTDILLKQTSGSYPAAQACNKYEPTGCTAAFCKKGKWFLPSYRDGVDSIQQRETLDYVNLKYFNDVNRGAYIADANEYWSSNEVSNEKAWYYHESGGSGYKKIDGHFVRPAVKY